MLHLKLQHPRLTPLLGLKHVLSRGSRAADAQTSATIGTLPEPVQHAEPQY